MGFGSLATFIAIAFGLSWGLMGLYILFTEQIEAIFGPIGYTNPLFIIAVYAPAFAGILLARANLQGGCQTRFRALVRCLRVRAAQHSQMNMMQSVLGQARCVATEQL